MLLIPKITQAVALINDKDCRFLIFLENEFKLELFFINDQIVEKGYKNIA